MSATPRPPESEQAVSPLLQFLAAVMLILPIAGLAAHAAVWGLLSHEVLRTYVYGSWLKAAVIFAFFNLLGSFFHYRHTRMGIDIASRILTYLWLLSVILLLHLSRTGG
ncbi:MAG TPA: hypothetical protein VMY69_05120 [Phycisphaerae bacterium]|nr:hypothetical protein [Phycisphaerae bacterium]